MLSRQSGLEDLNDFELVERIVIRVNRNVALQPLRKDMMIV